jgi:hypothetical protein
MNDLISVLREAMDDETSGVECPPGAAHTAWTRGRRKAHYERFAPIAIAAAVVAIVVAAIAGSAGSSSPTQVSSSNGRVRCEVPTRPLPGYLGWPCPTGTTAVRNQTLLGAMLRDYVRTLDRPYSSDPGAPPNYAWHMRVLAAQPVTGVQGGFTFLAAEVWPADRGRAIILYSESGGSHPRVLIGSAQPASLPVYNTRIIRADVGVPPQACNVVGRIHGNPTGCTAVFLVRSDAASVRLLGPRGEPPLTVPVRGGIAELPTVSSRPTSPTGAPELLRQWRVQALNEHGNVIGTNGYDSSI